jgi:hypothetical protein
MDEIALIQVINEPTWQRVVNNNLKQSIIDHLYVKNPTAIINLEMDKPLIGDHNLITFNIKGKATTPKTIIRRNWSNYTKEKLLAALALEPFEIETTNVQDTWNLFENVLINIIDKLAPLTPFTKSSKIDPKSTPNVVKRKINLRRKLLNKQKSNHSNILRDRIANLNYEIKLHFETLKSNSVRKKIIPGNTKTLWDAVKIAKNINIPTIPNNMTLNNNPIQFADLPDVFADFFMKK